MFNTPNHFNVIPNSSGPGTGESPSVTPSASGGGTFTVRTATGSTGRRGTAAGGAIGRGAGRGWAAYCGYGTGAALIGSPQGFANGIGEPPTIGPQPAGVHPAP